MISVLRMFYSVKYLIPWYVGPKKYVMPESSKEIESKSDQIYLIIKPLVSFNLGFPISMYMLEWLDYGILLKYAY